MPTGDPIRANRLRDQYVEPNAEDTVNWIQYPYGIRLDSDPKNILMSIVDLENWINSGEFTDPSDPDYAKTIEEYGNILKSNPTTDADAMGSNAGNLVPDQEIVDYFTKPIPSDTRVGCNDAINPYWQFNRDDDIRPPALVDPWYAANKNLDTKGSRNINAAKHAVGMGRVYASMYDNQQQILWIEAGVPRFTNLLSYYRDVCRDATVAEAINSGNMVSIAARVAAMVLKVTTWVILFPVMTLLWIPRWMERLTNERITKYYSFKSTMPMYYSMVNSMLQYTAVSMGLHPRTLAKRDYDGNNANGMQIMESLDVNTEKDNPGIPEILRHGPDIFKIMNRRSQQLSIQKNEYTTTELLYQMRLSGRNDTSIKDDAFRTEGLEYSWNNDENDGAGAWKKMSPDDYQIVDNEGNEAEETGFFKSRFIDWWSSLKGTVLGSGNHVGFKIEKGATFSEDFANTTGETGLAEKINSFAASRREDKELFGQTFGGRIINKTLLAATEGGIANAKRTFLESAQQEISNAVISAAASAASFDIGTVLVTGNGFLEIPKVWRSSTMTRNYSFSFKLRSRYGDPVSVFQSIYIPLFMLIALAAPRAIGDSSYTSPFLIRAYCRGMFHIPLGIITSLSINRGSPEFGWSSQFYPLEVNVTISIEDLSPQLFVSMNDGVIDTFSRNTTMQAYLDTLSSLGLRDMVYMWPKLARKMNTALAVARSKTFNPSYYGTRLGQSRVGKAIGAFIPYNTDRASQK